MDLNNCFISLRLDSDATSAVTDKRQSISRTTCYPTIPFDRDSLILSFSPPPLVSIITHYWFAYTSIEPFYLQQKYLHLDRLPETENIRWEVLINFVRDNSPYKGEKRVEFGRKPQRLSNWKSDKKITWEEKIEKRGRPSDFSIWHSKASFRFESSNLLIITRRIEIFFRSSIFLIIFSLFLRNGLNDFVVKFHEFTSIHRSYGTAYTARESIYNSEL